MRKMWVKEIENQKKITIYSLKILFQIEKLFTIPPNGKLITKKKLKIEESNLDIVATASKLRKDYETLYNQLRGLVYPKGKGKLGDK